MRFADTGVERRQLEVRNDKVHTFFRSWLLPWHVCSLAKKNLHTVLLQTVTDN